MKKEKIITISLVIIVVLVSSFLGCKVALKDSSIINQETYLTNKNNTRNEILNNDQINKSSDSKDNINSKDKIDNNKSQNNINYNQTKETSKNIESKDETLTINKSEESSQKQEKDIIHYSANDEKVIKKFTEIDNNVTNLLLNETEADKNQNTLKGTFITVVDFIFYEGQIDGITFNELTQAGKEKVLKLANIIDEKIENRFPKYKENITDSTKEAFKKAGILIKEGSNDIENFAKDKLGEENYNEIINAKNDLIKYTKNIFSIVGNVGNSLLTKSKDLFNSWYQNLKKENN